MKEYADAAADAEIDYETALLAYQNSLPQTGGATGNSGAILGNTTLWQALQMAEKAKKDALDKKNAADENVATLKTLAGIAQTDVYEATLAALEATVISKIKLANTYMNYKLSSIAAVANFSSMYEDSVLDISTYDGMISMYSSFYESSLAGASTLLGLADEDQREADYEQAQADAISHQMSSMIDDYNANMSSYYGYIDLSTFYVKQLDADKELLSSLSSFYDSTNAAVTAMRSTLDSLNKNLMDTDATYFVESSILNAEIIQQNIFLTQILDSVNSQESASYSYRETYCRLERIDLQTNYEGLVLNAVQLASTQTGIAQESSDTPVPDVAINLNTPDIVASYTTLASLNNFMDSFSTMYYTYDMQTSNIAAISTSLGAEKNTLSTFTFYDEIAYYTPQLINSIRSPWTAASVDYERNKANIPLMMQTYSNAQQTIAAAKQQFSTNYSAFFTPDQIAAQESEISSFMIDGYTNAIQNLAAQGIIFHL
jgi:hypothetical protein